MFGGFGFTVRLLASAITVALCFFFLLSFFFTSHSHSPHLQTNFGFSTGIGSTRRSVLALKSDPLKPRLDQIRKQADDHRSLVLDEDLVGRVGRGSTPTGKVSCKHKQANKLNMRE